MNELHHSSSEEPIKKRKGWSKESKVRRAAAMKQKLAGGWRPGMKNSDIPKPPEASSEEEKFYTELHEGNA